MPKTTKGGDAKKGELPSTLQRSSAKAQRTFAKAHNAAAREYGEGQRAHRVAYAASKHSFEKVGDHWEPKAHKGPSDSRAQRRTRSEGNVGGRRRRQRVEKAPRRSRSATGHLGPLDDEQE